MGGVPRESMARVRPATSYDVAKHAGVSQATVYAVFSARQGTIRVSEPTRQRVLAAAAALEYSPNPAAQALRRQRSGIIGFISHVMHASPAEQPLPIMYLLGIHLARTAISRGYHVLEASAESVTPQGSEQLVHFLLGRRVDGVIFERPNTVDEVRQFVDRGVPVVQLLNPQPAIPTAAVTIDPAPGIAAAVDHLVEQGHQRIAFVSSCSAYGTIPARLDAFHAALARQRLAVPEEYMHLRDTLTRPEGAAATEALLALPTRPTAIFTAGEGLAFGVLQALQQARVRVPDEMSLISFDDAFAAHLAPPLTSVAQPFREIAEWAIAIILEQLDHAAGAAEPACIVLPTRLVIRGSTAPPAGLRR